MNRRCERIVNADTQSIRIANADGQRKLGFFFLIVLCGKSGIGFAHPLRCRGRPCTIKQKRCAQASLVHLFCFMVRKEWDSNPRYTKSVRRISSPVHSITLASFRCKSNKFDYICKKRGHFFSISWLNRKLIIIYWRILCHLYFPSMA